MRVSELIKQLEEVVREYGERGADAIVLAAFREPPQEAVEDIRVEVTGDCIEVRIC